MPHKATPTPPPKKECGSGGIRTPDPRLMSPLLYRAELHCQEPSVLPSTRTFAKPLPYLARETNQIGVRFAPR